MASRRMSREWEVSCWKEERMGWRKEEMEGHRENGYPYEHSQRETREGEREVQPKLEAV